MPKIFLIKNRLHQQQLRLDSQNLLGSKDERDQDRQDRLAGALGTGSPNRRLALPDTSDNHDHDPQPQHGDSAASDEPLALVARKRDTSRNHSDDRSTFGE